MNIKKTIFAVLLIILFLPGFSQDIKITAAPESNIAVLNQELIVNVTIEGGDVNSNLTPRVATVPGIRILTNNTSVSSAFTVVNGKMSASFQYKIFMMPEQEGEFTIGPFSVEYKRKKYQSNSFKIKVLKEAPNATPEGGVPEGQNIFLAVIPDKKEAYIGEGITLTYKLYFQQDVRSYSVTKLPTTTGFWVEEYDLPRQTTTRTEIYNNQRYGAAVLKKMVIFPTSSGTFNIEPLDLDIEVPAKRETRRNRRSVFDDLLNDSFFERTVKRRVSSGGLNITVKPLPDEDKPLDFSGLVGDFDIKASIDKSTVKADEAITYKIEVTGTGNVKIFDQPVLNISPDFEIYDPTINERVDKLDQIKGTKTFEYVLIPRSEGTHKIEPVNLTYFDPSKKRYVTKTGSGFTIKVTKGRDRVTTAVPGESRREVTLLGSDIRYIKTISGSWQDRDNIFYRSTLFLALIILPLAMYGMVFMYSRHKEKMSSDIQYARNRKAAKTAQKRLSKARTLLKSEDEKFFAEMAKVLQDFIADKLNLSSAGLVNDEIKEKLKSRNIEEEIITELIKTIDECNMGRFSPGNIDTNAKENIYSKGKELIISLEKRLK
ncbi:BatD family protein [candidate division KSB1 bacterium]